MTDTTAWRDEATATQTPTEQPDPSAGAADNPTSTAAIEPADESSAAAGMPSPEASEPDDGEPVAPPSPLSAHPATEESGATRFPSVPDRLSALHPKGGLIFMRLLSRMQRDLALLTNNNERPATYPEVNEYLGHALIAEGIAPRGYTADEAAKWWRMGGSAMLDASTNTGKHKGPVTGEVAEDNKAGVAQSEKSTRLVSVSNGLPNQQGNRAAGFTDQSSPAGYSDKDDATAAAYTSDTSSQPGTSVTTNDESEEIANAAFPNPTSAVPKTARSINSRVATGDAIERAKIVIAATKTTAKTEAPAPFNTDLSTRFSGFGDRAHAFRGDYRTTPQMRAWLSEFEPLAKPDQPYPDGSPIGEAMSVEKRKQIREEVAYLYTLPEVKAFLDLIAHGEGADKDGYKLSHGNGQPGLPDLTTFYGSSGKGRYQIQRGPWRDYGGALWSRTDFSEITQDLIAISQLKVSGAIDALLKGDLSSALTLASPVFASIPVSLAEDHSRYAKAVEQRDAKGIPIKDAKGRTLMEVLPQSNQLHLHFRDLPAAFAQHLQYRRAEFGQAEEAWKAHKILPQAFISPMRWRSFGLSGFDRPKGKPVDSSGTKGDHFN